MAEELTVKYCARCLYPENAKPTIIFDEEGVCSGCRYHESRQNLEVDWDERRSIFESILEQTVDIADSRGLSYHCIVPVSGGKDSHFQVWLLKERYGLNPLLVAFNHSFNNPAGLRNLENLVKRSGCDLIRYTAGLDSVQRISRFMLETVGDLTWHYHAGIRTVPFQIAVAYNIPLIVWGEHGFAELTGLVTLEDFVEFTRWSRKEHDMRGYEAHDLVGKGGITLKDIAPYIFPSDEEIERVGVRGIYLSNFFNWDAKSQTEEMIDKWGFSPVSYKRDRTFNLYAKIDDHANDVHDYLKYLKFGYGRATDDASTEIRHGRMTREEGIEMVYQYDANEPKTLDMYCDFLEITKDKFYKLIDHQRDLQIWQLNSQGEWQIKDAVYHHDITRLEEKQRVGQVNDRTFSVHNRHLYYNQYHPPLPRGDGRLDELSLFFSPL